MIVEVVDYKADHLNYIVEQEATAYLRPWVTLDHMKALEGSKYAYTIKVHDRIVCCAGVVVYWEGRGEAWTYMDSDCKKEFYSIHRTVQRFLDLCPLKRIEATVDVDFKAGHRWVESLGFKCEAPLMKGYMPNGGDSALYSRVRG